VSPSALILSGSLGKGHDTVAEACAGALGRCGMRSRTVDSIALLGEGGAAAGAWVFRRLVAVPSVYDGFHFAHLRSGARLARLLDDRALRSMYPRFAAEADALGPDLVLSVFATGAAAAARYKADHPHVVTAVFMTDSFAHRLWVHDGTDLFLVTSELAALSVRRFRPRARVAVVTAPVRPAFYHPPEVADARARLGVPVDATCVLLMSGGWGIGPLDRLAGALASAGCHVLAVGGANERLVARLRDAARRDVRVHPFGYTDRIPELMTASDVVLTSSGDTCREARVVGRRLVLFDVVPGHGRENLMHELELGGAWLTGTDPDVVVDTIRMALGRPPPRSTAADWEPGFLGALADAGLTLPSEDPRR